MQAKAGEEVMVVGVIHGEVAGEAKVVGVKEKAILKTILPLMPHSTKEKTLILT